MSAGRVQPGSHRLAPLLGALAMFGAFSIDTVFPAFPAIASDFAVGKFAMQQTISVYLAAYAAMSLVHGPLSDALGRRPVILGGVFAFALASVGCALAPDMTWLLFFRVLQGLSAGVGMIVGRAVIRDCLEGEAAQRLMAHVSMVFGLAPAIAPIIGGWIIGVAHWRAIFWFLVAFALLLMLAVRRWLPETHPPDVRVPVHPASLWRGHRTMLGDRAFVRLAAIGASNFAALFLYISSAPAFVLDILGLDSGQFAWFFVPMISGMMLGAFTSGRLAGRWRPPRVAGLGFTLCLLAAAGNVAYNALATAPALPFAVLPMVLNAYGVALAFPVVTLLLLDRFPRQRGAASSLQAFVSLGLNALIAGALSAAVSHDPLHLALTGAGFSVFAAALWAWHQLRGSRLR